MRKMLKSVLSIVLALTIVLSSAAAGLGEIDFVGAFAVKSEAVTVSDLTFTLSDDGTCYSVTACDKAASGSLMIPLKYEYIPVTAIAADAFRDCTEITSITIPGSVVSIGGSAFRNCTKLTEITFPESISTIPGAVCFGCTSLESVVVPGGITSVGGYAFSNCTALKYVFYSSDETAWSDVTIGSNNTALTDAVIHYNSTGHSFSTDWTVDATQTCTEDGIKSRHCTVCDAKTDITVLDATGHSFSDWDLSKEPTCTENGVIERVCGNCGTVEVSDEVVFEKLLDPSTYPESKHNYGNNIEEVYEFGYEYASSLTVTFSSATCTESGCDYIYFCDENNEYSGTGRYFSGKTIKVEGNWFAVGLTSDSSGTRYGFSIDSIVAEIDTSAYGHGYSSWTRDTEPTCTQAGSESRKCYDCGNVETRTVEALEHSFDWTFDYENRTKTGVCSVCQLEMTDVMISSDALTFALNSDGTAYSVKDCLSDYPGEVIIPDTYKGLPVTAIYMDCFSGCISVTSIVIPDSITDINYRAFYNCKALETVTIGKGVKNILDSAFWGCEGLKNVYISDVAAWCGIQFAHYSSNPMYYADNIYLNGELITELVIPEGVTAIPINAFEGSSSITSVVVPDSVTSVGNGAFYNCTNLKSVTIGSGVTSIGEYTFENCTALEKVIWNAKSVNDFSQDYIFENAGTEGEGIEFVFGDTVEKIPANLCYKYSVAPKVKSVTIGDNVKTIGDYAFYMCAEIESLTIGGSVESIGKYSFHGCKNIASVIFPDSVSSVGEDAFSTCAALESVELNAANLGDSAFYGCTSLKNVELGANWESIGNSAFSQCTSLESVLLPFNFKDKTIGAYAFQNCISLKEIIIPSKTVSIGEYAFLDCTSLESATVGINVETIGQRAFSGCKALEKVEWKAANVSDMYSGANVFYSAGIDGDGIEFVFADTVKTIPAYLCYTDSLHLPKITSVVMGENVEQIGQYAFYNITSLKSVTIPQSIKSIDKYAFCGCSGLEDVYISGIGAWCNIDFYDYRSQPMYYADNMYLNGEPITDIVIPEGVTDIPCCAFNGCSSLVSVTIPESVNNIYYDAFSECPNLEAINVHENNTDYHSEDGILFDDITMSYGIDVWEADRLMQYPAAKTDESYVIPDNVKSVSECAFAGSKLKSITIPSGVETIGEKAFADCVNLEKIYWNPKTLSETAYDFNMFSNAGTAGEGIEIVFGDTVEEIPAYLCYVTSLYEPKIVSVVIGYNVKNIGYYAFRDCDYLENVVIGNGVTSIHSNCFAECGKLKTVTIGENVTDIGDNAFGYTYSLQKVNWNAKNVANFDDMAGVFTGAGVSGDGIEFVFGDSVEAIPANLCYEYDIDSSDIPKVISVTMGDNVKYIGSNAFRNCKTLVSVKTGESTPDIGDYAFYYCTGLNIFENKAVGDVYDKAFYNCNCLTAVTMSDNTETIGDYAFYGCYNISKIAIPDNVDDLGQYAFYGCSRLYSLSIGDGVKIIPYAAFYKCTALTDVVIPDGVTIIYGSAFSGCSNLENITIPDSVTYIGSATFYNCYSLKNVTIPDGVTTINDSTFYNCSSLETVSIPETVTSIGYDAFYYCYDLKNLTLPAGLTSIGTEAFYYCSSLESINIPKGITGLSTNMLKGCSSLKEINVDEENPNLSSDDGVLFDKNKTVLIKYPSGKTETKYTIPDGVNQITSYAFERSWYGESLTSIVIPASVTNIGDYVFNSSDYGYYDFPAHSFFYVGSETDWEGVAIGQNNNLLTNAIIHFNATDHTNEEIIDSEPTCTESGSKHLRCSVCGYCSDYGIIPETGHDYSDWIISFEPTCTEEGEKYRVCANDEMHYERVFISPTGHDYIWEYDTESFTKSGSCSVCGEFAEENMTCVDAMTFTLNSSGTAYTVTDFISNFPGYVEIPEEYKGLPVTVIGTDAFRDCTEITSVIIPDSVISIGGSAFRNCTNLTEIILSHNITTIPGAMCFGCTNLETVTVFGNVKSVGGYAFSGCSSLKCVFYENDEAEWNKITFGASNTALTNAPIHFESTGDHTYSDEWTIDSLPTCDENGSKSRHCDICGHKTDTVIIKATGHIYGEWSLKKAPTCAQEGLAERVCSVCNEVQSSLNHTGEKLVSFDLYPESEHNYDNNIHEVYEFKYEGAQKLTVNFSSDTNTESGYDFIRVYASDGELYGEYSGRELSDVTITLNGDCFTIELISDDSVTRYGFSIDSIIADMGKLQMVKPVGHNYQLISTTDAHPHSKVYSCSVCGDTKTEPISVDDCVECNFTITPIDANSYKLVSYIGSATDVVIPSTYKGRKITAIGNGCFRGKPITSVTIADSVTTIGDIAFMQCTFLKKLYIPSSVTTIGANIVQISPLAVIYCKNGSVAHQYAVDNNKPYVLVSILETENTRIDYENFKITTSVENCNDIAGILGLSENVTAIPVASYVYGNYELYGTGTVITVFDGDEYIGDFTLIVEGDTNGDSVCDVLDCFAVEKASNSNTELSGAFAEAGDINGDGVIDISDYQSIVNKATA